MNYISTTDAPEAIGPYSQAISAGGWLFSSGIIGLTKDGEMSCEDLTQETKQVCANLTAILAAGGSSRDQVIKTTLYLADMADFAAVNTLYESYFGDHKPARSTVEVAALPKGARLELDVVAISRS